MIKVLFYILTFVIVLPGELVAWGRALDVRLAESYLAKRLQLSCYFEIPQTMLLALGCAAAFCMVCGFLERAKGSHSRDILIYGGFPLYMLVLFLYFRMPCSVAFAMPLILLTAVAVWCAYRPEKRPDFLLPDDPTLPAAALHRATVFFQLLPVLLGASLIFQEGYQMWIFFRWTPVLAFLPLAGVLLPKVWQLREYAACSVYALILCSLIYLTGHFFATGVLLTDFSIAMSYIFLELMIASMIRMLLPPVHNISLALLGLSALVTPWIMPPVCSPWIVAMTMFVLYLFIDNRKAIRKKLFARGRGRRLLPRWISETEFAALAWGCGMMLAVCLAGLPYLFPILFGLGMLLGGGLIRSLLLNNASSDHVILDRFPFATEIIFLILAGFVCSYSREKMMVLLSVCAAASCLMQLIWSVGGMIGKYVRERPALQFFHILSHAGRCFLLVLLFFMQAPASVLLGCFCILSGIVRIGTAAYRKTGENPDLTAGWVLIVIGQFFMVSSSEVLLPEPGWVPQSVPCAFLGCAALYVYCIFDYFNRKRSLKS